MKGLLHIPSEDGSVEIVTVLFSQKDVQLLSLFCEDAWKLNTSAIFGEKAVGFTMKLNPSEPISLKSDALDDEAWHAAMLRMRPLILQQEPASFFGVASLLGKKIDSDRARAQLKAIHKIFRGENAPFIIELKVAEKKKSTDEIFYMWLNAYEHHRDQDKRDFFAALVSMGLDYEGMRCYIYMHAVEKLRAIMYLFDFVVTIFGDAVKPTTFKNAERRVLPHTGAANG